MVYIICFIVTLFFTKLASLSISKNSKFLCFLFSSIAILIPSIIAGVRALDVGRDINLYVTPVVNKAINLDFFTYLNSSSFLNLEIGYKILIFFATKFLPSVNFSLFIIQFLTFLFIYLYTYKNRNKIDMTFCIAIYLLLWYCVSFTFMRQSLAIAIIIYSTISFNEKKYFKTFVLFLLAISFHESALISILIYLMIYLLKNKNYKKSRFYLSILLISTFICTIFFNNIINFLVNMSILSIKYYNYTQNYLTTGNVSYTLDFLSKSLFLIMAIIYKKYNKKSDEFLPNLILSLLAVDFSFFLLSYNIVNISRGGLFFYYLGLFELLPRFGSIFKKEIMNFAISALIIIFIFSIWFWKFPVQNWCETWTYHSDILEFLKN